MKVPGQTNDNIGLHVHHLPVHRPHQSAQDPAMISTGGEHTVVEHLKASVGAARKTPNPKRTEATNVRDIPRSSQAPKMQTFGGKPGEWESFIFHFKRVASFNHWSDKEKRDQLLACLRGKAVSFIQSKSKRTCQSYDGLKKTLDDDYGVQELPSTARQQLGSIRQEENESIEEFADRVLVKAMEAFHEVKSRVLPEMATDSSLRSCRDKYAAYAASEKKPENLHQAIQEVRDSITNLRVFGRVCLSTRQVTFESDVEETGKAKLAKLTPEQEAAVKFIADALSKSSLNVNDY